MKKTLPAFYYTDPEHFGKETERFFANHWVCVGREDPIPKTGDFFVRNFLKESLLFVRTETGVSAYYNVCRHRGTRICEKESGNFSSRITCPYHAWSYGLDGALVKAPHMAETPGFLESDYPLHTAHCETWEGHLFVHLGSPKTTVHEQLRALQEKFKPWAIQARTLALNKNVLRQSLPGLQEIEKTHIYYYWVSPNLLLSLHPDYMLTHTLWPKAINQTEIICEWHFHPDEMARADFNPSDAVEFWDMTNRQDWHVSELSQLGIQSRVYAPGPYSVRENLLPHFDEVVRH